MPTEDHVHMYQRYVAEICEAVDSAHADPNVQLWGCAMKGLMICAIRPPHFYFAAQERAVAEMETLWVRVKAHPEHYRDLPNPFAQPRLFPASLNVYYGDQAITALREMAAPRYTVGLRPKDFLLHAYKWLSQVSENPEANMREAVDFLADLRRRMDSRSTSDGTPRSLPQLDPDVKSGPHHWELNKIANGAPPSVTTSCSQLNEVLNSLGHPQMLSRRQHQNYGQRRCL